MPLRFLFVEDQPAHVHKLKRHLRDAHNVECTLLWEHDEADPNTRSATGEQLFANALLLFQRNETPFDLMILDIRHEGDFLGGIRLYNRLLWERLRSRWRNVAVLSNHVIGHMKWTDEKFEDDKGNSAFHIALWADTALIPSTNILNRANATANIEDCARRLIDMASIKE